jgi:3-phosphoshikimate 1-carboxyvinyltransferase
MIDPSDPAVTGHRPEPTAVCIPPQGAVTGRVRPPGSKSITNRALVCAALAEGHSLLRGALESEDTRLMAQAWQQLGLAIDWPAGSQQLRVAGCGGQLPVREAELYLGNSGTSMRFLTAALAGCQGQFTLSGVPRMHHRPIGDLLLALEQLGGHLESLNADDPRCPPLRINARGLAGGRASVAGDISSQFLSGLMMAAPLARSPVRLELIGQLVSQPYVAMTAQLMRRFGVSVRGPVTGPLEIDAPSRYRGCELEIEPDASAASYFWGAAAITGGRVLVEGLTQESLQGDVAFTAALEQMGCRRRLLPEGIEMIGGPLRGITIDMGPISDTVQTLAAVALFAEGTTHIHGVGHNRFKETDRIGDLATELRKLGAEVHEHADGLSITPQRLQPARLATYNDHRMAMSFSLIGLGQDQVWIENPGCTVKTYPNYFSDLAQLIQQPLRWETPDA